MDNGLLTDCIYDRHIQYMRKGKWKNCQLKIKIIRRCQDKLMALILDSNDKSVYQKFGIYGYECNNDSVSLIENDDIHLIKFERLELVPQLTDLLGQYMKDVSYKVQLRACNSLHSALIINEWYTLHVQTNRICFTMHSANRLVTKWHRADILDCYLEDFSLNIEIISKKGRCMYTFFRGERFPLEKLFKAIQNLKFQFPQSRPDKLTLTPRRSGSVDLRRVPTWGNTRERLTRDRTQSFSRAYDSFSNDDSSSPSTPVSPLCITGTNETMFPVNYYTHIDEKDEELEELMFPLDSTDTDSNAAKTNGYRDSNGIQSPTSEFGNKKLVELERFPYESDLKVQGKLSPELHAEHSHSQQIQHICNPSIFDKHKNGYYYHTIESLLHHRKAASEANFAQHQSNNNKTTNISHSADVNSGILNTFTISSDDKISNCSSPMRPLSSSNQSSDTQPSSKSKETDDNHFISSQARLSPIMMSFGDTSEHDYYNVKSTVECHCNGLSPHPLSLAHDDSQYYNLAQHNSSNNNYRKLIIQDIMVPNRDSTVSYVELDFQDNMKTFVPKKIASHSNYTEISIFDTEILKGLDSNNLSHVACKKKKSSLLKSFFRR